MLNTFILEQWKKFSEHLPDIEKMKEFALRYFPDNEWLRKQWWHRLALVLSGLFFLICLILAFLAFFGFMQSIFIHFQPVSPEATAIRELNKKYGINPPGIDWASFVWTIVFIIMGIAIPNAAYRAFLYVKTNNRWKLNLVNTIPSPAQFEDTNAT